ncbi:MAG: hypothetical protein WCR29_06065 [Bacteroidales bacterium]|nr:hypothetical protein [Bacteroidales bacterium]
MSLIKSISGFRGTIGGLESTALTPIDIVKFTSAPSCGICTPAQYYYKDL